MTRRQNSHILIIVEFFLNFIIFVIDFVIELQQGREILTPSEFVTKFRFAFLEEDDPGLKPSVIILTLK